MATEHGEAWHRRAAELADWAMARLVNRTDRYGGYYFDVESQSTKPVTCPVKGVRANCLTPALLVRHFRAAGTSDVIGVHGLGVDSCGRWVGVDVDAHPGMPANPEANRAFALSIYASLKELGFAPLLYSSNGNGGYHVRVLFHDAVSGETLYVFGHWLVRNHREFGFEKPPEVFPKQVKLSESTKFGNWMRLPGRHHTRDYWCEVWDGAQWLAGDAAIDHMLALPAISGGDIPGVALEFDVEPRTVKAPVDARDQSDVFEDFNRSQTVESVAAILRSNGWTETGRRGDRWDFRRPGKDTGGDSGNLKICDGTVVFYPFTSSTALEQNVGLNPSQLRCQLEFGGQFARMADRLRAEGYGAAVRNEVHTPKAAQGTTAPVAAKSGQSAKKDPFDSGILLPDLLSLDLPPMQFVFDGILPEGLTVLAGRPKQGKSWLAMLMGISAASAACWLGAQCRGGRDVLHLALEDTRRRYRDRSAKIVRSLSVQPSYRLDIRTSWPRAGKGGLARLAEWLKDHPGGIVIIDTLVKFRDPPKTRGNSYEEDYEAVSSLKALADEFGAVILVITHTRKLVAEDPFDEISGTLGINGAADGMMVLERVRGSETAALFLAGRDIPEQTLVIQWSDELCIWSLQERRDGIERPEKPTGPNKIERCAQWLSDFLGACSWPDSEVLSAAKREGFTEDNLKRAKATLRKKEPRLCSKARGSGGVWWQWMGHQEYPKPDRETPHTPHTGVNVA